MIRTIRSIGESDTIILSIIKLGNVYALCLMINSPEHETKVHGVLFLRLIKNTFLAYIH